MLSATSLRSIPFAAARAVRVQGRMASTASRHEGNPEVLEKGKQQVQREQANKDPNANWKEELASDSEAIVKSVREEIESSKASIKELQEQTKETMSKKRRESNE